MVKLRSRRNRKDSQEDEPVKGKSTKVITGPARSSYMFVRELTHPDGDEDRQKTCRCQIMFPKKDKATKKKLDGAVAAAARKKFGSDVNMKAKKFKMPIRDGDEELESGDIEGDHYKGMWFFSTTGYKLPGVLDEEGERVIDADELDDICVSGYWFRFSVTARGFDNDSKGVRMLLNNLMFVKEDDRFDGSSSAEEDFSDE